MRGLWQAVIDQRGLGFTATFLSQEWREVVLSQNLDSEPDYLDSRRSGRGVPLSRRQRQAVWKAVESFEAALRERKLWTHESVLREAFRISATRTSKPFRHVVVDEAQDLSQMQWRLLRAIVTFGANDMFIAGDSHQRIYSNYASLRALRIHTAGRSSRLRINYRTTAEILAWGLGMMRGKVIDDLDEGLDTLAGCRSEIHGEARLHAGCRRAGTSSPMSPTPSPLGWRPRSRLVRSESSRGPTPTPPASPRSCGHAESVRGLPNSGQSAVADTMHRMKGLEFRCVLVAGASDGAVPLPNAVHDADTDEQAHALDLPRERSQLLVACTRAREDLFVT